MSTWYLVATGNVNTSTPFATSSGGAGGAGTPTTGDTIICDGNSGAATLTFNVAITLASLDCQGGTGAFTGTIIHNGSVVLTINTAGTAAFRLSAGMTWVQGSSASTIAFTLTSGTAVLTSAGQRISAITCNGVGGTVQQADDLTIGQINGTTFTLTAGTWDMNTHSMVVPLFNVSGTGVRAFLGGSTLTVGGTLANGGAAAFNSTTPTNMTWTPNSLNIAIGAPTVATNDGYQLTFNAALSYNDITFNIASGNVWGNLSSTGAITCANLTVNQGWSLVVPNNIMWTITGVVTITGTPTQPCVISTNSFLSHTWSCASGSCTATWAALNGVVGTGGANFTYTNSLAGALTGWTGSAPSDLTAAEIATAVWQDLLSSSDFTTAGSAGALMAAMANLQYTVPAIGRGTVGSSASTTSVPTSAFSPSGAVANQFAGRVILFDAATTTTALRGQVTTISASSNAATPTFTVSTLTTAPASGDTFSVI